MSKRLLKHSELESRASVIAQNIAFKFKKTMLTGFPIPRGGIPAAYLLQQKLRFDIVDTPEKADFFIDDILDSGATMRRFTEQFPGKPFYALVDKRTEELTDWIIFPWEGSEEASIDDNIIRLLQFIGEDPTREGLKETPARVIKAWQTWAAGYQQDPAEIFKTFSDGGEECDDAVLVKDIPFYSHCEHHLAPFFGTASIAYIPNEQSKKIVGLSKLIRLVDIFARRLQVQERLTAQVTSTLDQYLQPRGVACIIKARHLCMESRGVSKSGHHTITSSLKGVYRTDAAARAEIMALLG